MIEEIRKPIIIGSKKGGGGGATEASDTLFARHKAAVLDVVSEGEIVGLVDGDSSIFFNETRLRDKDAAENNFKGVETIERYGTQDQDIPKRFLSDFSTASVTQDFSGNGKLELNTPQYLKITTGSIERSLTDYLKVSIFTDSMYKLDKKGDNQGDATGSTVSFDIEFIYTNDAGVQTVMAYQTGFNGKCSSKYIHTFGIDTEAYQPFKDWEVKVTRIGGDISTAEYKVFNNIYCGIVESQITDKLEYPLTAYIGIKLDAEAFGTSIPKRAYDLKGIKISVPTNYFASDVGAKKITLASATNFAIGDPISSNFSISTITSNDAVNEGLTATATCASAHGIPVGQIWRTTISGATTSGTNYYNGTFDAVATTATKFTYQMSLDPDDDAPGGTIVGTAASGTVLSKSSNDVIVRDISNRFVLNSTVYDTANHSGNSTTISAIADNPINFASYTRNVSTGAIETTDQDWDGNFYTSWTDNPAWVYYDLLTNKRYGLGNYIDGNDVDKWELFSIAKYCDELVNDPTDPTGNTTEPRFTCNLYLTKATEAYKVLQDLASIFRGMQYWINGTIVPVQDREKDPVYQFTDANVIDGSFEYEGSARKTRHNMAKVTYNNPDNFHKQTIEYVQDAELLAKEDSFPKIKNIVAFGCTSRGQALRLGKWVLTSEKLNYETIKFKTGLNASFLRPGDVINVLDARRQGVGWAGRVLKPTTSSQLVTNGTFGSGISSWTQGTATQSHDTSNKRIKLTSGGTAQTPRSYQSLGTLTSGRTYRIKARVYHGQTADSDQYAKVYISTATNGTGEVTTGRAGTYRTNSATETYIDFTVPAASTAVHYLQIEGQLLDNTESVTFDSIEVYQVNTTTSIKIDRDIVIASGKTYTLTLTKPGYSAKIAQGPTLAEYTADNSLTRTVIGSTNYYRGDILSGTAYDTQEESQKVQDDSNNNVFVDWSPYVYSETKTVNTSAATVSTLGVSSEFSKAPDDETIWILQRTTTTDELKAQQYTVLGIAEDGEDKFDITGLKYNASKFDFVDKREALETHRTINAPTGDHVIPLPTNLRIVPAAVKGPAGTLTDLLSVAWSPPTVDTSGNYDADIPANNTIPYEFTKGYQVRFRTSDHEVTDWQMLGVVTPAGIEITQPQESTYNFQIRTVNMNNMMSSALEGEFTVTPSSGILKSEGVVSGVNLGGRIDNAIKLTTSNVTFGSTAPVVTNAVAVEKTVASDPGTLAFAGLSTDQTGYVYWDHSAATLTAKITNTENATFYSIGGSEWASATGTVTCTEGSEDSKITGYNDSAEFLTDFNVGSKIRVNNTDLETYTIISIIDEDTITVMEPIQVTRSNVAIKKETFVPDRVNDVIIASVTEASGPAWSIVRHAPLISEVVEPGDIDTTQTFDIDISGSAATTTGAAGSATTATALANARTIGMTGDVVWTSPAFDGSANVTAASTIQTDAVDIAMLSATGTASGSTFLRGDNVWGSVSAGSDTTYTHTWQDSSANAILRLTAGGSGSGNDDLTIIAGSNITLTPSGDNLTIAAGGGTDTNYYLTGVTKSGNTLTYAVSGASDPTYTFGSNAFNSTAFTTNTGTVTSVATSGSITGGTITGSGTITHLTTAGNKHVPTGGSSGEFLKYDSSGTAVWATVPGGLSLGSTSSTAHRGDQGATAYTHSQAAHAPSGATTNTGTVTSVATTTPIEGGTITGSGTITHSSAAGYKHVPTGGSSGQFLKYSSSGTAVWAAVPGGLSLGTGSGDAHRGDHGSTAYTHSQVSGGIHNSGTVTGTGTDDYYARWTSSSALEGRTASQVRSDIGAGTSSLALGSSSSTAHRGDQGATAYTHSQVTGGVHATGTVTSVGTNTGLSGTVTGSGSLSLDLDSLADMTQTWVNGTDEFIVLDDGTQKKKLSSEIFGSNAFNSTAFTTNVGTVTSVTAGGGMTQSGTSTVNPTFDVVAGSSSASKNVLLTVNTNDVQADVIDGGITNVHLGFSSISLDKMVITQFPTVVWRTTWTDSSDNTPDTAGEIFFATSEGGTTRVSNTGAWSTIRSMRIYETDKGGLNIAALLAELTNSSYIRIKQGTSGAYAVIKVKTVTDSGVYYTIDFGASDLFNSNGTFTQDSNTTIVEFQVKTDAVVDGNLLVTGTVSADALVANTITADEIAANTITAAQIAADTITADQIYAADAEFTTLVADIATFTTLDTDTLNADAVIARTIQVGEAGNLPTVSGATPSGRGALLKSDGDFFVGNASTSKYMLWDQSTNILEVKGTIRASAGDIGGWDITSTKIASAHIELDDGNDRILISD